MPNAAIMQVTRFYASRPGGSIHIRLQATPVDGKANAALRKWLAGCLGVQPSKVALVRGSTSQHKQLKVSYTANANWSALLVKARI